MFGRRGPEAPGYIDGRNSVLPYGGGELHRKLALMWKRHECEVCGVAVSGRRLHVHHLDRDHENNNLSNLQVLCPDCHNSVHGRQRDCAGRYMKEGGCAGD
jgi:5-methylcytosine-specific restriction endonuclease McrA